MVSGQLVKTITEDSLELQGFWVDQKSELAVLHTHGTAGDFYTHKFIELEAERLSSSGISFLSANNRGHDVFADLRKHSRSGSKENKIDWVQIGGALEKFEDCILDIGAWIGFLEAKGVKRVILQGHSLTQKLLYYSTIQHDHRVVGQIHLSPCNDAGFMFYLLGERKYAETNGMIDGMVRSGRGIELLPKELAVVCPMSALAYSGYLTEQSTGNLFPYHQPNSRKWEMLATTQDPLLIIFGGADNFIKPSIREAVHLFKGKAKSAKSIAAKIIPNAPHSFVGHEDELINEIEQWLKTQSVA